MSKKKVVKTEKMMPIEVAGEVMKLEKLKKDIEARLRDHKRNLLIVMKELGVKTLKTETYTLYRSNYKRVRVVDDVKAFEDLVKRGIPAETKVVLDMDVMKLPLDQLVKEKGEEVDGVELQESEYVSVRLAKEK